MLLATVLVVAGVPMLADAGSSPLGVLLLATGLATVALPSYLRRSRTG